MIGFVLPQTKYGYRIIYCRHIHHHEICRITKFKNTPLACFLSISASFMESNEAISRLLAAFATFGRFSVFRERQKQRGGRRLGLAASSLYFA